MNLTLNDHELNQLISTPDLDKLDINQIRNY